MIQQNLNNFFIGEWFGIILIEEFFVDEVKSKSFSSSVHPGDQVRQLLACFHLKLMGYIGDPNYRLVQTCQIFGNSHDSWIADTI